MDDLEGGFLVGVIVSVIIAIALLINLDNSFDVIDKRHKLFTELCGKLGSVPHSYDSYDLTCKNGLVVEYKSGGE